MGAPKNKGFEADPPRTVQALKQPIMDEITAIPVNMLLLGHVRLPGQAPRMPKL